MDENTENPNTPEYMKRLTKKLEPSDDIVQNTLTIEGKKVHLLFLKSVVDPLQLQSVIVKPFFEMKEESHYAQYINSLPYQTKLPSGDREVMIELTKGNVLVMVNDQLTLLELKIVANNTVQEADLEPTMYGPQMGMSESLEININLIRQRYHDPSLIVETLELDEQSNRGIALLYDKDRIIPGVLDKIKERLQPLDVELVQAADELIYYINNKKRSLFPTSLLSGRPDRLINNITAGKVIILVDGSPHGIVTPIVFFDFMASMEDRYNSYWIMVGAMILRYGGLFTGLMLPGAYVGITSYNPDVFRTELALTVAASRIGVPYPSFIEVFFMLIFVELLTEASLRLPVSISATATTVGGLILGTAVVEAALASNIIVIVVSLVAISTFVIPINEMSYAIRTCRFFLLLYATLFGLAGLVLGMLGIIMFLSNKDSLGQPYLRMYWWNREKELKAGKR